MKSLASFHKSSFLPHKEFSMDRRYPLLNKVMFIGRLVRDCEVKYLESGTQITHFSIALDGAGNRGTEAAFIDFSKIGEFNVAEYLKKGTQVFVEGHIDQTRKEVDGQKRTFTNFLCDRLQLLSAARSSDEPHATTGEDDFDPFGTEPTKTSQTQHADKLFNLLVDHYGDPKTWNRKQFTSLTRWVEERTGTPAVSVSLEGLKAQLAAIPKAEALSLAEKMQQAFARSA
jgi:single-strand DNA-binding protein